MTTRTAPMGEDAPAGIVGQDQVMSLRVLGEIGSLPSLNLSTAADIVDLIAESTLRDRKTLMSGILNVQMDRLRFTNCRSSVWRTAKVVKGQGARKEFENLKVSDAE
jgi:hypothetical protein